MTYATPELVLVGAAKGLVLGHKSLAAREDALTASANIQYRDNL